VAYYYHLVQFTDLRLYTIPKGLAVRYLCRWVTPEDMRERPLCTMFVNFVGERIAQIGTRLLAQQPIAGQRAPSAGEAVIPAPP
jgi:hypothetical protein